MQFKPMLRPDDALAEWKKAPIEVLAKDVSTYPWEIPGARPRPTMEEALKMTADELADRWLDFVHWDMISSCWFARLEPRLKD